jgi:hypothetical protein
VLELGGAAAGTTLNILISYAEQPSDPTTEAGGPGNTRITEMPHLTFSKDLPADPSMTLILAAVPRTAAGLGTIDSSGRRQAGVVLGTDLTIASVTLKKDGVAQANWPSLSCSAANQAAVNNGGLVVGGSVGIGTPAPATMLDVRGQASFQGALSLNHAGVQGVGSPGDTRAAITFGATDSPSAFYFGTYDANAPKASAILGLFSYQFNNWLQYWAPNGNVGIGTAAPGAPLDVAGAALGGASGNTQSLLTLRNTNGNANFLKVLQIRNANGSDWTTASTRIQQVTDVTNQGYIDFNPANGPHGLAIGSLGSEYVRVAQGGNVGIGTTSPVTRLHIRSDAAGVLGPTLTLMNGAGSAGAAASIDFDGYDPGTSPPASRIQGIDDGNFSAHLTFSSKKPGANANQLAESMRITSAGNVGIGTASPAALLDVGGGLIHVAGTTTPSTPVQGAYIGWNALSGGTGETDFINNQGGGSGGFAFMNTPASGSPRTTLLTITGNGKLNSLMWRATQVMNQRQGALPINAVFASGGGTLVIIFSGSGYSGAAGNIGIGIQMDNTTIGTTRTFTNEPNSHKAFTTNVLVQGGVAAGNHTINLFTLVNTITDANDWFNVTILELPF